MRRVSYSTVVGLFCPCHLSVHRICVETGRGCSDILLSPLAASQNFEVTIYPPVGICERR